MNFKNKSDAVRNAAKGRWLEIFEAVAPALKDAVQNCPDHVPCPIAGGTDGFRLFKDADETGGGISNGLGAMFEFDLLMWVLDRDFPTVLNDVADYLGINGSWKQENFQAKANPNATTSNTGRQMDEKTLLKRRHNLRETWMSSVKLTSGKATQARRYFVNRGLDLNKLDLETLSETVRFNPSCELWHKKRFVGRYPAIISLVSYSDGKPACIHRTYLDHNGNKLSLVIDGEKVDPKKLMGRCENRKLAGGAIRLGGNQLSSNGEFHVAEGIETALSVMQAKRVPVWPCVNSTLLGLVEPPEGTKRIIDWSDKDVAKLIRGKTIRAGSDAAVKLGSRMLERNIDVLPVFPNDDIPEGKSSVDWNDVLVQHGEKGFPSNNSINLAFM
jgi:hypothetical protein